MGSRPRYFEMFVQMQRDPIIGNTFLDSKLRMDRLSDAKKIELKMFMNFIRTNSTINFKVSNIQFLFSCNSILQKEFINTAKIIPL
ncbi:hypothetical protein CSV74_14145 [Sporosarcina sp. P19]|nr:hypothetical protein CSV74_14145 [Sporosarcina sp. P19]